VIIADSDHLSPVGSRDWVWKSFTRGLNPIYMDPYKEYYPGQNPPEARKIRRAMGEARAYAMRMDLEAMLPDTLVSTTRYALAHAGVEYLVYQPVRDSFSVDLPAGTYAYEYFSPVLGMAYRRGTLTSSGGAHHFPGPLIKNDLVLYLRAVPSQVEGGPPATAPH
jgi:hypothetical protein